MIFRIYLRDAQQRVTDKTVTSSPDAARAAFLELTERADLDGSRLLAVLNRDGRPVAHHRFDGLDPAKQWRGLTGKIDLSKAG
jgi:hypothetical protein